MRVFIVVALIGLTVSGCGLMRQREYQERVAALKQQSADAAQLCQTSFPVEDTKRAVARAQCLNDASLILRPIVPYPDLLDLNNANRMEIAEKSQKGQITRAQAVQEFTQLYSNLIAEEQRRLLANRSVNAQETAAVASVMASGPRSCTVIGNSVNCY